jgi:hypothetical protein
MSNRFFTAQAPKSFAGLLSNLIHSSQSRPLGLGGLLAPDWADEEGTLERLKGLGLGRA